MVKTNNYKDISEFTSIRDVKLKEKLDKFDCEAESKGTIITNYKLYEMKRKEEFIRQWSFLIFYFAIGILYGMLFMLQIFI